MQEQPQQQITPALYSTKLPTKSQTYFFDVKAAKNGNKYLNITQSRIKDGQKFRNTISLFQSDLEGFNAIFAEAQEKVK